MGHDRIPDPYFGDQDDQGQAPSVAICSVLAVLPVAVMTFPATFVEKKLHMALLSFTRLSVHIGDVG